VTGGGVQETVKTRHLHQKKTKGKRKKREDSIDLENSRDFQTKRYGGSSERDDNLKGGIFRPGCGPRKMKSDKALGTCVTCFRRSGGGRKEQDGNTLQEEHYVLRLKGSWKEP